MINITYVGLMIKDFENQELNTKRSLQAVREGIAYDIKESICGTMRHMFCLDIIHRILF